MHYLAYVVMDQKLILKFSNCKQCGKKIDTMAKYFLEDVFTFQVMFNSFKAKYLVIIISTTFHGNYYYADFGLNNG